MQVVTEYTVQTETSRFAPCWWPAATEVQAESLAKELSAKHATDPTYPNAFWVIAPGDHVLGKYFNGCRYAGSATI